MGTGSRGNLEKQPAGNAGVGIDIAVVGAHRGAGVTTLAALLGSERDLGVVPRHSRNWLVVCVEGRPLVLVSRNTTPGVQTAASAVSALKDLGGTVAVLAVIKDRLPEPMAATHALRALASQVGGVVRIPFVPALRGVRDPLRVSLPKGAIRALADLRALATASAPSGQPTSPEGLE